MLASYVTLYLCAAEDLPDQPLIGGRGRIVGALLHGAQSCSLWAAAKSQLSSLPSQKAVRVY